MKLLVALFGAYGLAIVLASAGGYVSSIYSSPPDGVLTVGSVFASRGQPVEVPITLETDVPISGVFLHLSYNSDLLEYDHIRLGPDLSGNWRLFSNEPTPGNLRVITLGFTVEDLVLNSDLIFVAGFKISPDVTAGEIPVSITFSDIENSSVGRLDVKSVNGSVKIVGSRSPQLHGV